MKVREMIRREEYINDTVHKFSDAVSGAVGAKEVSIPFDDAKQIMSCLSWLQNIFKENIDCMSVYELNVGNLPEY